MMLETYLFSVVNNLLYNNLIIFRSIIIKFDKNIKIKVCLEYSLCCNSVENYLEKYSKNINLEIEINNLLSTFYFILQEDYYTGF